MILYRPTDGDVQTTPTPIRPRTCFVMTKLGQPIPPTCLEIRQQVESILTENKFGCIDANSATTGRDFLHKIWELIVSVPMGIAIIYKGMPTRTMSNIFYELGWMHALGKETLLVKASGATIPSDFVRTEYVVYGPNFRADIQKFIRTVEERVEYLTTLAELLENNPILAIDYYRRAYLLSGDAELKERALKVIADWGLGRRAPNSVEMLLAGFAAPYAAIARASTASGSAEAG